MRSRPVTSVLAAAVLLPVLLLTAAPLSAATTQATRSQLRALRARIAAMAQQNSRDASERERLTGELRSAELALSEARSHLALTGQAIVAQAAQRAALSAARAQQLAQLAALRQGVAQQLRAAYLLGRDGALKLLFNQASPLRSERLLTYYGYVSHAGAQQMTQLGAQLQRLEALDGQLVQQQQALAQLQRSQQTQLQQLSSARQRRQLVLVSLQDRSRTREQQLSQLQSQQTALEQLLEQLGRAPRAAPIDTLSAFGRLQGQLAWPVTGHIAAQFGQQRASGVRWDGVLIATTRAEPVHAVAAGRVVYADWLPGLGLLMIIDHGQGYLSLYAHNDRLFRAVGARVSGGEVIASAGDTGGRADPQLYFEIRRAGEPIDPLPWFRSRAPTP